MKFIKVTPVISDKDGWPMLGKAFINKEHIMTIKETKDLLGGVTGVEKEELDKLSLSKSKFGDFIHEITLINGDKIKIAENIDYFKDIDGFSD